GTQPAQRSGTQPAQRSGTQPAQRSGTQPAQRSGTQPAQRSGTQPAQRSGTQPDGTAGLTVGEPFDGMGLRGNDSRPVTADGVEVPADAMLGPDGGGFDIMLGLVLPYFQLMSAGFSVATADDSTLKAAAHAGSA